MSIRDTFAQPRCAATAIHGATEGAWEYRDIAHDAPTPNGWRRVSPTLIKFTHWERVYP